MGFLAEIFMKNKTDSHSVHNSANGSDSIKQEPHNSGRGSQKYQGLHTCIGFVLLLLLLPAPLLAQTTLSGIFLPIENGIGIRVDQKYSDLGAYFSLTYGNYDYKPNYVKNHFKMTVGGIKYLEYSYVGAGLSGNYYGGYSLTNVNKQRILVPVSMELCAGVKIDRFVCGLSVDIIKYDIALNFGYIIKL